MIAITGETGTGKSLISSAFSLAAGARVRGRDLVGSNGPTARVQLELELANEHVKTTSDVSRGEFTLVAVLSSSLEVEAVCSPLRRREATRPSPLALRDLRNYPLVTCPGINFYEGNSI